MVEKSIYTRDLLDNSSYKIGLYTYGKPTVYDWGDGGGLIIGKYTSIADDVNILLGGNHRTDWVTTYPFSALTEYWLEGAGITGHPTSKGDVIIGNDVWIGNGATLLSGIKIGNGAVIAARAVVVRDVEPYTIVGGNPSRVLKKRFSNKITKELQRIQWWDWSEKKIRENIPLLCSVNIKEFIKLHKA